jgi:hypothetical protein
MGVRNMSSRRLVVGAAVIEKFEDLRWGKSNPRNKVFEGINGEFGQIRRSSNLGFIEIDVLRSSSANQILQAIFLLGENVLVAYQDDSGEDLFLMSVAAPEQDPDGESSEDEAGVNTWRFVGVFDAYNLGGNS